MGASLRRCLAERRRRVPTEASRPWWSGESPPKGLTLSMRRLEGCLPRGCTRRRPARPPSSAVSLLTPSGGGDGARKRAGQSQGVLPAASVGSEIRPSATIPDVHYL